jgi:hypothetical protein
MLALLRLRRYYYRLMGSCLEGSLSKYSKHTKNSVWSTHSVARLELGLHYRATLHSPPDKEQVLLALKGITLKGFIWIVTYFVIQDRP